MPRASAGGLRNTGTTPTVLLVGVIIPTGGAAAATPTA
jgi:hypothetical protein